jgi:hypothetical protein
MPFFKGAVEDRHQDRTSEFLLHCEKERSGTGIDILTYQSSHQPEPLFFYDQFPAFDRLAGRGLRNTKPLGKFQSADAKVP